MRYVTLKSSGSAEVNLLALMILTMLCLKQFYENLFMEILLCLDLFCATGTAYICLRSCTFATTTPAAVVVILL